MRHSRTYLELMAARGNTTAAEQLKKLDAKERREARKITPSGLTPGDEQWLNEWLERSAAWLITHFQEHRHEEERYHVRLKAGSPVTDLASETRLRIMSYNGGNSYEVLFPCKQSRAHAISFIQNRIGELPTVATLVLDK